VESSSAKGFYTLGIGDLQLFNGILSFWFPISLSMTQNCKEFLKGRKHVPLDMGAERNLVMRF